jgi:hypothetical protein
MICHVKILASQGMDFVTSERRYEVAAELSVGTEYGDPHVSFGGS